MKKIVVLSLTLLMVIFLASNVYATSHKIDLKVSKETVEKGEEFTVDVILKDIDAERGIIAITATIEYDRNVLEYVKMDEEGNWSKPSYNDDNGKFVTERNGYATTTETITKVTFKAKQDINVNDTKITVKDISSSNGIEDIFASEVTTTVKINSSNNSGDNNNTGSDNNNQGGNGNSGNNNSSNNNNNNNRNLSNNSNNNNRNTNANSNTNRTIVANTSDNLKNGVLPNTGTTSIVLGAILLVIAVALIIYSRIRFIDKGTYGRK